MPRAALGRRCIMLMSMLALAVLAVAAIASTLVDVVRDGYRPVATLER